MTKTFQGEQITLKDMLGDELKLTAGLLLEKLIASM